MKLAAAQFPVSEPCDWQDVETTLSDWVARAAAENAQLLLFPEYAAMSVAAIFAADSRRDLALQLAALQTRRDDYLALHRHLAQQHRVYLVAGSFPWRLDDGRYVNRAFICAPSGRYDWQDKQIMTRFERETWGIAAGNAAQGGGLKVFDTALGRLTINICYDSEFPLFARAQCAVGAELLLVPSCTDTLAGYHRVRVGCQARALENQCVVVQSPLVGSAPWSAAVDVNVGRAGVFGPPDRGFPDDGVLCLGEADRPHWLYAEIDLARVAEVRREGQVFNFRHWPEQRGGVEPDVEMITL